MIKVLKWLGFAISTVLVIYLIAIFNAIDLDSASNSKKKFELSLVEYARADPRVREDIAKHLIGHSYGIAAQFSKKGVFTYQLVSSIDNHEITVLWNGSIPIVENYFMYKGDAFIADVQVNGINCYQFNDGFCSVLSVDTSFLYIKQWKERVSKENKEINFADLTPEYRKLNWDNSDTYFEFSAYRNANLKVKGTVDSLYNEKLGEFDITIKFGNEVSGSDYGSFYLSNPSNLLGVKKGDTVDIAFSPFNLFKTELESGGKTDHTKSLTVYGDQAVIQTIY